MKIRFFSAILFCNSVSAFCKIEARSLPEKLVFIFLCLLVHLVHAQNNYGKLIYCNHTPSKKLSSAIRDLQTHLQRATTDEFVLMTGDSTPVNGIQILKLSRKDSADYPSLFAKGKEAAWLVSDGKQSLKIFAFNQSGLVHGVYEFMDTLGFRWYLPGDEYAFIPTLKSIRLKLNKIAAPDFQLRSYFGTFGTPRNIVVDREKKVDADWYIWNRRNRMGGEFVLQGHAWNDFMWKNGKALRANPQFMALVNGERVKVATASKFCVSDTGLQQLFVNYMVKKLSAEMEKSPGAERHIVSVEPSDGEGFCTCRNCRALGGISNQVFLLANLVAKKFQEISPTAFVNLYAYNRHAAPPSFDLEPNVIVQIIPYKFQWFAKPNQMIEAWKGKTHELFLYDYYGLPTVTLDAPLTGHLVAENYAKRFALWKKHGIKGITLETSHGTGAVGLGLYLYVRLSWNLNQDIQKIVNDFYKDCYGINADVVRASREALSDGSVSQQYALKRAIEAMQQAKPFAAKDSFQQRCLLNHKVYLIYLKKLYDFNRASQKDVQAKADELMTFIYSVFFRNVVHPNPVADHLLFRSRVNDYIATNWNYSKPKQNNSKFKTVRQLSDGEIETLFAKL